MATTLIGGTPYNGSNPYSNSLVGGNTPTPVGNQQATMGLLGQGQQTPTNTGATGGSVPNWDQLYGSGLLGTLASNGFNQKDPYTTTLPGVGAGGRYPANNIAIGLAPAEYENLASQLGFANSLQPQEHQIVQQYLNYLMNPTAMSQQNRNQELGAVANEAPALANQIASAGGGSGNQAGAQLALFNQANRAANSFDANLYSPQGQAALASGALGLIGSQNPNWGDLATIASITDNTPRNASGAQVLGGLAGNLVGAAGNSGGFGKLF